VRMQSIHSKRDAANWTSEYMIMAFILYICDRRASGASHENARTYRGSD
jgi:hypothetical protein